MELNLQSDPTIMLPLFRSFCKIWQRESSKMKTIQILYVHQTPNAHISNVSSYVNQYILN
jgi:hypothetical protein